MAIWIPKPGELEQTRRENRDYEEGRLNDRIAELERELERLREEIENVIADAEERVAAAYRVAEVDLKGAPWPPDYDDYDPRALWRRVWLAEMATKQADNIMAKAQRQRDSLRAVVRICEHVDGVCPVCEHTYHAPRHEEGCALRAALEGE